MKAIMLALGLLFLNACEGQKQESADNPDIETTILARFEEGRAAWNRGDLDGYLAGYWDSDKTRWASGGTVLYGKNAIVEAFRARFPSPKEMGSIETAHLEIDVLSETDALVFGRLVHTVGDKNQTGIFTVHLQKMGDNWFVVSDHFSAVG